MANANRAARIEAAADICRINAVDTVRERIGAAALEALDFNAYLEVTDTEKMAQAGYFADEHGVTRAEVLKALNLS